VSNVLATPTATADTVRSLPSLGGLITVAQAAEEYPISKSQLRHLIGEKRIPFYKMVGLTGRPHGIRLARCDLDALFVRVEPTSAVA
jgi:excisionase family DNA binding protein